MNISDKLFESLGQLSDLGTMVWNMGKTVLYDELNRTKLCEHEGESFYMHYSDGDHPYSMEMPLEEQAFRYGGND